MARQKWAWTDLQETRASQVKEVVDGMKVYWPLTLRQIYYQLVVKGYIENNKSSYNGLSKLLKWMRIDDRIPWRALEDRSRRLGDKKGFHSMAEFCRRELNWLFEGYERCLIQSQLKYLEVWVEKDALSRIFDKTVYPYCIRSSAVRGYSSVTFLADYYGRASKAIMQGKRPIVLYFGDLDPSGVQMLDASIETLEEELDLYGVEFKRIGLNPEHIEKYNLPSDPHAIKMSDSRYAKYVKKYGPVAVELDALHPEDLQKMIHRAIRAELDMSKYDDEKETGEIEEMEIEDIRTAVIEFLEIKFPRYFDPYYGEDEDD